ncbi:hypothetical protein INR49_019991 [Caranx melampygus]|nr:hypothetical protein INR49_019991 [Caranx melampygus]
MTSYKAFHAQLTSIMEALAKAAVAEICGLVDESYAVLQMEISRSHKENEALRRKLEMIETIIARGHRDSVALLDYGGPVVEAGGGLMDLTVDCALPPANQPKASSLKRRGRVPALEAATDDTVIAAEEAKDQDVVLIKDEIAKEEVNENEAMDELLLNEDGTEVQPSGADDSEEGPSGVMISTVSTDVRLWDQTSNGLLERVEHQDTHSAPGSPGPTGATESSSSDVVFDLASESDCEAPPTALGRKQFLPEAGGSPASLPGTSELKRGVSLISSLPYDTELNLCSSWTSQGLPSMVPVPHRPYLKPDHRPTLLDKSRKREWCGSRQTSSPILCSAGAAASVSKHIFHLRLHQRRRRVCRTQWELRAARQEHTEPGVVSSGGMAVLSSKALHEQLSIIMGALTKAAVAEICEVVDEGYAVLQMEITRSHRENEDLKKKLHLIESIVVRGSGGGKAAEPEVVAAAAAAAEGAQQAEEEEGGGGDGGAAVVLREEVTCWDCTISIDRSTGFKR